MMKHLKRFDDSIESICKKYGITNYSINIDESIDVDGDVNLYQEKLTKLPLKFNKVGGHFYCSYNQLTTLEGSPREVGGYFYCNNNKLTTLEGSPREVGDHFNCSNNQLTTLEGSLMEVGGDFYCNNNKLPQVIMGSKYLKKILTQGDDFYIWKRGKLDMSSFEYMIEIFEDEDI